IFHFHASLPLRASSLSCCISNSSATLRPFPVSQITASLPLCVSSLSRYTSSPLLLNCQITHQNPRALGPRLPRRVRSSLLLYLGD
ncbi:hypothetical protein VIGAN_03093200, partial [Vigna angularis var. angularis]